MSDNEFTSYSVNRSASDPLILREIDTAPTLLGEALAKNADNGVRIVQTLPVAVAFNQRREPRMSPIGYSLMAQPGVAEQLCMHEKDEAMTDDMTTDTPEVSATVTAKWAKGTGGYAGINETENLVLSEEVHTFALQPDDQQAGRGALRGVRADVAPTIGCGDHHSDRGLRIVSPALTAANNPSRSPQSAEVTRQVEAVHAASLVVRRLTPLECERLMGWGENHTLNGVEEDGKEFILADSHRYRLCGNGVVANVSHWLAERLLLAYRQADLKDNSSPE